MELEVPKQLPNVDFRKLVKSTRDPDFKKEIYGVQEQRKIDWPAYNLSQVKQVKETLNFIRESVNFSYCCSAFAPRNSPVISNVPLIPLVTLNIGDSSSLNSQNYYYCQYNYNRCCQPHINIGSGQSRFNNR